MTRIVQPSDFLSTRVLGYSIIESSWSAFYAAVSNPSQWELLWYSGGAIDVWADPNHVAWAGSSGASGSLENPTTLRSGDPDRVIYCLSGFSITPSNPYPPGGYNADVSVWLGYLDSVLTNIRTKYPNVRSIILQPPVTGPSNGHCTGYADSFAQPSGENRQTYHAPYVKHAIAARCKGNVRMGGHFSIPSCSDFADWSGHLNVGAARTAFGQAMASYYGTVA